MTLAAIHNGAPARASASRGRSFTDLADVLSSVTSERRWLFDGAIEGSPIVVWCGPEKSSKSWTWIDAAIAAATGGKWLGAFACARPGPAVYLDAEYGPYEFARRFSRVCRGRGVRPGDVLPSVHHYYARDLYLAHDNAAAIWLLGEVRRIRPSLVVIDPLRNMLPGDENSAPDVLAALSICAQLRDVSDAAIGIVHHLNKQGTQSGSRALLTRADLAFEGTDVELPVYGAKGRTIRRGDAIARRFSVALDHDNDDDDTIARTRVSLRFEGERSSSFVLTVTATRVLDALPGDGTAIGANEIKRRSGVTNGTAIKTALEQLREAGSAQQDAHDDGKWRRVPAGGAER